MSLKLRVELWIETRIWERYEENEFSKSGDWVG